MLEQLSPEQSIIQLAQDVVLTNCLEAGLGEAVAASHIQVQDVRPVVLEHTGHHIVCYSDT